MRDYDITIEIVIRKSYQVGAEDIDTAHTLALERAIKDYPGADVWVEKRPESRR